MVDEAPDRSLFYNIVTIVMLVLTAVVAGAVLLELASANPLDALQATEPTLFMIPSLTPTLPPPTVPPTSTITLTMTSSPTRPIPATDTPTSTLTPSATDTPLYTETPTGTLEPTATETFTPSATPTLSPFDYILQNDAVTYTTNFANAAGCDWAGLGGQVFDIYGNPKLGLRIHITGGGIDEVVISGSNASYGAGGWERMVNNRPTDGTYYVQLETSSGDPLSDMVVVQMIPTCENNLALVYFNQVNP
jgi:hypothetical protein